MVDKNKIPEAAKSFRSVCLVENSPNGEGIQVTAYGNDGNVVATGKDFVTGKWIPSFVENIADLVSVGGRATGDSYVAGRKQYDAAQMDQGIALNLSKGLCDVSSVDRGANPDGTMRFGVVLKNPAFEVTK